MSEPQFQSKTPGKVIVVNSDPGFTVQVNKLTDTGFYTASPKMSDNNFSIDYLSTDVGLSSGTPSCGSCGGSSLVTSSNYSYEISTMSTPQSSCNQPDEEDYQDDDQGYDQSYDDSMCSPPPSDSSSAVSQITNYITSLYQAVKGLSQKVANLESSNKSSSKSSGSTTECIFNKNDYNLYNMCSGGSSSPQWGCGLKIDSSSNTVSVKNTDMIGPGLKTYGVCALQINTGCGVNTDGDGKLKVTPTDLAGPGLTSYGTCGLQINAGCGLGFSSGALIVKNTDLAGSSSGLVVDGTCGVKVNAGCGIQISSNAVTVKASDLAASGSGLVTNGTCGIKVNTGCGLTISGNAVVVNSTTSSGPSFSCITSIGAGASDCSISYTTKTYTAQVNDCGVFLGLSETGSSSGTVALAKCCDCHSGAPMMMVEAFPGLGDLSLTILSESGSQSFFLKRDGDSWSGGGFNLNYSEGVYSMSKDDVLVSQSMSPFQIIFSRVLEKEAIRLVITE